MLAIAIFLIVVRNVTDDKVYAGNEMDKGRNGAVIRPVCSALQHDICCSSPLSQHGVSRFFLFSAAKKGIIAESNPIKQLFTYKHRASGVIWYGKRKSEQAGALLRLVLY